MTTSWLTPRAVAIALAVTAFAVYATGAAPGVEWLDSGELTAAGWSLGVSHPPGQPGYSMIARLAAFLPLGEVAFRVNVLSGACMAIAVWGTFALARALVGKDDTASFSGAALGAIVVIIAPISVEQATRAEVYAPAAALVTWGAALATRFVRGPTQAAGDALAASLLFALAVSVQPLVAAMVALPCAIGIAATARRRLKRLAPWAVGIGVLGLSVLVYLPLRASAPSRPLFVWGEPSTMARFLDVVRGTAYGGNFAADGIPGRFVGHLMLLAEGTGFALVLAGGLGLLFGALTRLRGSIVVLASILLLVAGAAAQRVFFAANPDVHGYLLPALCLLGAGIAVIVSAAGRMLASSRLPRAAWLLVLVPILGLAAAGPTVHVDGAFRRADDPVRFVDLTIGRMPAGPGVYFEDSDHALFPAIYERIVCGNRPDVAIANDALLTSSWFLRMIDRSVPEIFVPYVDDGGRVDALELRLAGENLRAGRPVGGETSRIPGIPARPQGIGYRFQLERSAAVDDDAELTLDYEGKIGGRIASFVKLLRAQWRLASITDPLWHDLPVVTPVFLFEDWQAELIARDAAFAAMGVTAGAPPDDAPFELKLLHAWHLLLGGDTAGAEATIAALPPVARAATERMLLRRAMTRLVQVIRAARAAAEQR
jgi:hypothetical protein